jgi:hypothetical protein
MPANSHECQKHDYVQLEKNLTSIEAPLFGKVLTKQGSCLCSIELTIANKAKFNSHEYRECQGPLDKLLMHMAESKEPTAGAPQPQGVVAEGNNASLVSVSKSVAPSGKRKEKKTPSG